MSLRPAQIQALVVVLALVTAASLPDPAAVAGESPGVAVASKSCVVRAGPPPNLQECTFTYQATGIQPGHTHRITLSNGSGMATFRTGAGFPAIVRSPGRCRATVVAVSEISYQTTFAANRPGDCAGMVILEIREYLIATVSGTIVQTVLDPQSATSSTATGTITAVSLTEFSQTGVFEVRCVTPSVLSDLGAVPAEFEGQVVSAIGLLPAALVCQAGFWVGDSRFALAPVAPGTIEIGTDRGLLLDLRGVATTNLRLGCGLPSATSRASADVGPNTCLVVRFAVIGRGVGVVNLRAHYEQSAEAAAAGIVARESETTLAFVARAVNLSLTLNPNPVGVNQTGVASLRFIPSPRSNSEQLIDPRTGLAAMFNTGTLLNGTVTFTSSDPAAISFLGGFQISTLAEPGMADTGVISHTGRTIAVRCGTADARPATDLAAHFGGCDNVVVYYRGGVLGTTTITATFVPDLPNVFGGGSLVGNIEALREIVASNPAQNTGVALLDVVSLGPDTHWLAPGCNSVVAPAMESVLQIVMRRVAPSPLVNSVWKQVLGTTMFHGAAVGGNVPARASDLTSVNALDAIFICVSAIATYRSS